MTKAWLRDLEERVEQAAEEIRSLRQTKTELQESNRQLEDDKVKLQQQVEDLTGQLAESNELLASADQDEAATEWRGERDEIRQRVEKLVDHLGGLLTEE